MTFAEALKAELESRGITYEQSAKELGVLPHRVSEWARGVRRPSLLTYFRILYTYKRLIHHVLDEVLKP